MHSILGCRYGREYRTAFDIKRYQIFWKHILDLVVKAASRVNRGRADRTRYHDYCDLYRRSFDNEQESPHVFFRKHVWLGPRSQVLGKLVNKTLDSPSRNSFHSMKTISKNMRVIKSLSQTSANAQRGWKWNSRFGRSTCIQLAFNFVECPDHDL